MKEWKKTDVLMVGAGIMSATLASMLHELDPKMKISVLEKLDTVASESSDAWNNAGTGHSAFCELNYTPEMPDGSVNIKKATEVASAFELSKSYWTYLVKTRALPDPSLFIHEVPHMSFVTGQKNVSYLKKRYETMKRHPLFSEMKFSSDHSQLRKWMPLMMEGRSSAETVAATCMERGCDVNFGCLTRELFKYLTQEKAITLTLKSDVISLKKQGASWLVISKNANGRKVRHLAKFVFIGAGGGALPLLEKSRIPEAKGYGGFPVSGQWLICHNPDVIKRHAAKVYGLAETDSPPMSVPHLDTRIINDKKHLLFGPYAGFSTKFLKHGSYWDLFKSIRPGNILPMLSAGIHNLPLTRYLIRQVSQSETERLNALKKFVPLAHGEDWKLEDAGQRVQIIKKDEKKGGVLEFGTEVVKSSDGSLAALLGASPGASVSVSIMLSLIKKCFASQVKSGPWKNKLEEMVPVAMLDTKSEQAGRLREENHRVLTAAVYH